MILPTQRYEKKHIEVNGKSMGFLGLVGLGEVFLAKKSRTECDG
jgi:hypothetical protein